MLWRNMSVMECYAKCTITFISLTFYLTTQSLLHFIFQIFIWNRGKPGILYERFGFRKDRDRTDDLGDTMIL